MPRARSEGRPTPKYETEDRRERIADAALSVLAELGARGLTHRAVDRALGLPDGSTSFYFRTRAALVHAAATRLIALDSADLAQIAPNEEGAVSLALLWTSPARRTRSLARLELLLTAARDPAFRLMRETRLQLLDRVSRTSRGTSRVRGVALIALVDGLTLHGLLAGAPTRAEAAALIERLGGAAASKRGTKSRTRKRSQ